MPAPSIVRLAIASTVLLVSMPGAPAPARADQLLVGFDRSHASAAERADAIGDAGARSNALVVAGPELAIDSATTAPGASVALVERRLEADPRVSWVIADGVKHPDATAYSCAFHPDVPTFDPTGYNDPLGCLQWWMRPGDDGTAGIGDVWSRIAAAPPVTVGVVDTGIDMSHPDLAGQLWTNPSDGTHGFNVVTGTEDPSDVSSGHGTEVAGMIAAATDNGVGIAGACPNCRLLPVVVFDAAKGGALDSDVIAGIDAAARHGAQVVNLSLGSDDPGGSDGVAYAAVFKQYPRVTFVMSAGNKARSDDQFPQSPCDAAKLAANAICVAATDFSDALADFSDYGSGVAVAAPGDWLYTTARGGGDTYDGGTSLSAPLVSAAAALLRSQGASARQSVQAIIDGADFPASMARQQTKRRLSVAGALQELDGMGPDDDPPPVATPTPRPSVTPRPTPQPTATPVPAPRDDDTQPAESRPVRDAVDPTRDPKRLTVRTPRWRGNRLRLPIRCRAACTLTVRAYARGHRVLLARVRYKKARTATLTARMSRSVYKRIKRLHVTVTGQYAVAMLSRRPARLR
jgi:subtilisin family serine protease